MTRSQRSHAQIAPVALIVAGLGAANWYFQPQRARTWIIAMGTMAVIWLVVVLFERVRSFPTQTESERRFLVLSVVTAGLMLAVSLGIALIGGIGFEGGTLPKRVLGIMMGLVLVVIGNTVPKVLGPLAAKRCSPVQTQSVQRFAGWTFTIAGLAYTAIWTFAAIPQAEGFSTFLCVGALMLVIGRWVWASLSPVLHGVANIPPKHTLR